MTSSRYNLRNHPEWAALRKHAPLFMEVLMTDKARKTFLAGLRDAYGMEKQAKDMMASQARKGCR